MMVSHLVGKELPAQIESERCILGAILLDNSSLGQTVEGALQADDFSLDSHRRIYTRMCEMSDQSIPIDFNTLTVELDKHKELEAVGGTIYVTGLTDGLPRVKNIAQYVRIVRDKAQLRNIIHLSITVVERAMSQREDAGELVTEVMQSYLDIYRSGGKAIPSLKDSVKKCFRTMDAHLARGDDGRCIGLTTGLRELDDMTTGYSGDNYYIIGGRPSSGKSSLALQAVRENCKAGKRVSFFSIEMSDEVVLMRLASMETKIPVCDMRDWRLLTKTDLQRVQAAMAEISEWPLDLHCGTISLRELRARAKMQVSKGTELIVVDYLQHPALLCPGYKDETQKVSAISSGLCEIGKSNGVPVVALSQLSRAEKTNRTREPRIDDLRQSGQIEQDADVVMFTFRPEGEPTPDGRPTWTGQDKIIIAKQRNGPAGESVLASYNGPMCIYQPRYMNGLPAPVRDAMQGSSYDEGYRQ